jgi:hypothetical protein
MAQPHGPTSYPRNRFRSVRNSWCGFITQLEAPSLRSGVRNQNVNMAEKENLNMGWIGRANRCIVIRGIYETRYVTFVGAEFQPPRLRCGYPGK